VQRLLPGRLSARDFVADVQGDYQDFLAKQ
jgi:hypothetical protein